MSSNRRRHCSTLAIASVVTTPVIAIIGGFMAYVLTNFEVVNTIAKQYSQASRFVVFTFAGSVALGIISGVIAIVRKDKPRWLPVAGLAVTGLLLIAFHFGAVGPDGD